jgi:hypothetical protein
MNLPAGAVWHQHPTSYRFVDFKQVNARSTHSTVCNGKHYVAFLSVDLLG